MFDDKNMNASRNTVLFLLLQVVATGLAVLLGWHFGPQADQAQIANLETRVERLEDDLSRSECAAVRDLQAVLRSLQALSNTTGAVRFLNHFIDKRITAQTAWVDTFGPQQPENPVLMPKNDMWFSVITDVADYRQTYPSDYAYPEIKKAMDHIFIQAREELERKASNQASEVTARKLAEPQR
jgi:hypothetical protein